MTSDSKEEIQTLKIYFTQSIPKDTQETIKTNLGYDIAMLGSVSDIKIDDGIETPYVEVVSSKELLKSTFEKAVLNAMENTSSKLIDTIQHKCDPHGNLGFAACVPCSEN